MFINIKKLLPQTMKNSIIIFCAFLSIVLVARLQSIDTPTFHLDGAFQTASGLYRLHAGQFPGRDFYPYLGIGPLYSLYPIFEFTGHNMAASVFAAYFSILLINMTIFTILWQLIWEKTHIITSLTAASFYIICILSIEYLSPITLPDWFLWSLQPGNSLRPLRAFIPYLVVVVILFLDSRKNSQQRNNSFISGIILGLITLWSNDFAIPTALLFILLFSLHLKKIDVPFIPFFSLFLFSAISSSLIFPFLATHGHFIEMIRYNFIDVASDQWWYFAPYEETSRIFSVKDLHRLFSEETYFPLFILLITSLFFFHHRTKKSMLLLWLGIVLCSGGILASVGGHIGGYFGGFYFWGALASGIGFSQILYTKVILKQRSIPKRFFYVFQIGILILSIIFTGNLWKNLIQSSDIAKNDSHRFYVPELGGYLPSTWKSYIDLVKENSQKKVFEEYWGIWSALKGTPSTWPVDATIHALGHTRDIVHTSLDDAEIITTTRHSFSGDWQSWNLSQNYWFYEDLLENYAPFFSSPNILVWEKTHSTSIDYPVDCQVSMDRKSLTIRSSPQSFFEVTISYKIPNQGRMLLMAENGISYGGDANGYVSLDINASQTKFPVYLAKETSHLFRFLSLPEKKSFIIEDCSAKKILLSDSEVLAFPDSSFYASLTDARWNKGIGREHAGFLLPNRPEFREKFSPGKIVILPNGDQRTILWTHTDKQLYSIVVSGNTLQSNEIGYPTELTVISPPANEQ